MGEELTLIVALILANGIFAGTELAMVSARRGRLQQKADDGSQGATAALALQDDPNRLLSTVQVGITVISTLTGVFGGAKIAETLIPLISVIPYVASYADTVALALVVLIISYLSLVLGELVPKRLALQHAEWIAVRMAVPMTLMAKLSRPLVWLLTLSTELLLKLAGQRNTNNSAVTEDDIRQLVREGTQSGAVEHHEREIIEGVFGLGERTVRQVMTPRTDVYALEANATIGETVDAMLESGYSRAPVYEKDLDHVVGVVHARDVLRLVRSGDLTAPVKQAMRTPWFIPEQSRAATLLGLFKKNQQHLAIVVGELGTVEGIITLEDIMEEIVGDIADEYDDAASPTIVRREDGSYLVDGTTPIDDVVERTELAVRDGESARFDTVAGYALMLLGRIPQSGDIAEADGWRIEVVDMDGLRIDKVLISRL
ncbi:MAG: hemolysin family protein [Roseiflexaceae bacterium]|jgi:putative hemolysin|nr:hemolysin family protein [Chloroflexaceae bacterium]